MNPTIITIIISLATFVLSIFGALQFYSSRMETYIDAKIDGLSGEINARFETVRAEIQSLNVRVERIERQLESLFKPTLPPGR